MSKVQYGSRRTFEELMMSRGYYGRRLEEFIDKLREQLHQLEKESREWQTKYEATVMQYQMEKQKLRLAPLITDKKCKEQEMEIQKLRSTVEEMDSDYDDVPELVDYFREEKKATYCHRSKNSAKPLSHSDKSVKGSLQDCCFEDLQPGVFERLPDLTGYDFKRLLSDCDRLNDFPHGTGSENDSRSDCGPPPSDCHRPQDWRDSGSNESEDSNCNKSTISKSKRPVKKDKTDRCKNDEQKKKTQIFSSNDDDCHSDKGVKGSLQDCCFEGLQPSVFESLFPDLTRYDFKRLLGDCDRLNDFPHGTGSENDSRSDCGPPPSDCHSKTPNYSVIQDQRRPSQPSSSRDFERQVANHPTANGSLVSNLASKKFS